MNRLPCVVAPAWLIVVGFVAIDATIVCAVSWLIALPAIAGLGVVHWIIAYQRLSRGDRRR